MTVALECARDWILVDLSSFASKIRCWIGLIAQFVFVVDAEFCALLTNTSASQMRNLLAFFFLLFGEN